MLLALMPEVGRGRTVLDLGCSAGYLDSILAERGFQITGIDLPGSDWSRFPAHAEYFEADLDAGLPRLGRKFDFIVCADVLEHLKRPERLLRQFHETLAPGGILVASLPNSGHLYFRLMVLAGRFPAHDRGLFDRTHLRYYMWRGWRELFAAAAFEIAEVKTAGTPFDLGMPSWVHGGTIRRLDAVGYALARSWKTMFAYQFVVSARPSAEDRR